MLSVELCLPHSSSFVGYSIWVWVGMTAHTLTSIAARTGLLNTGPGCQRQREYRSVGTKVPGGKLRGLVFTVRSMTGERGCGSSASVGTMVRGRVLTMAVTSVIRVMRCLCINCDFRSSSSIASSTRCMVPICLSHDPQSVKHEEGQIAIHNPVL